MKLFYLFVFFVAHDPQTGFSEWRSLEDRKPYPTQAACLSQAEEFNTRSGRDRQTFALCAHRWSASRRHPS